MRLSSTCATIVEGTCSQNRYRSILCDSDAYLLQLVRYTHLNPIRAELASCPGDYPWSSHRAYLTPNSPAWLDTATALQLLGGSRSFEQFVGAGIPLGRQPALSGYADRSRQGARQLWQRGQVLGSEDFARRTVSRGESLSTRPEPTPSRGPTPLDEIVDKVATQFGVSRNGLLEGSRARKIAKARREIIWQAVATEGHRPVEVCRLLGVTRGAITHCLNRT